MKKPKKPKNPKNFAYKWKIFKINTKNRFKRLKDWVKSGVDREDKKLIKSYLTYAILQGAIVNLAATFFGVNFSVLHIVSLGSILWIIETKLIGFWRRLFYKNPRE